MRKQNRQLKCIAADFANENNLQQQPRKGKKKTERKSKREGKGGMHILNFKCNE